MSNFVGEASQIYAIKKEVQMLKHARAGMLVLAAVLLVTLSLFGCKAAPSGPQEGVIRVGNVQDLTGPAAASGVPITQALEDYFKYVNEELGGIRGHKVEFIVFDTRYDNNLAVTGFEKLVNQDKVSMIWVGSANHAVVCKPLGDRYQMPTMAPTEYAVLYPHTPDSYMFGIIPHYADMYRCSLTYLKANWKGKEPPRIGIMGLDASFSKSVVKPIKWMLENELKWPVVAEEWMTMTATDVTSQVTNLKNAKCDYVLEPLTGAPQFVFQKMAKAAGLSDQSQLIDIFITTMITFRRLDPVASEGIMSHSPVALPQMRDKVPAMATIESIHKKYRPDAPGLDWIRTAGYAGGFMYKKVLEETIDKYGYDGLTGENIKWVMENKMKNYDAEGLAGPLPWSPEQHGGPRANIIVKTTPDFTLEILKEWQTMPPWPKEAEDANFWKM